MDINGVIGSRNEPAFNISLAGQVRPPADMIGAARNSLSVAGFADLMNQTGGAAPSPAQLCAAVELERSLGRAPSP